MYSNASAAYDGLKLPSRALAAVTGDKDHHAFLAGTCCLKEANELQLLHFSDDTNELTCAAVYSHPDEIWDLAPCPSDRNLVLSCHNNNATGRGGAPPRSSDAAFGVMLWRLPAAIPQSPSSSGNSSEPASQPIDKVASLGSAAKPACALLWEPGGQGNRAVTVAGGDLVRWELSGAAAREATTVRVTEGGAAAAAAAWDPHTRTSVAVAAGCGLRIADTRSGGAFTAVANAHRYACRDVDYSPYKPSCVVTCGEDRLLRFWDLRAPGQPLKSVLAHRNHWATRVAYNRFHDQLLATAGSDAAVCLWRVSSLCAAPGPLLLDGEGDGGGGGGGEGGDGAADVLARTYGGHEDSVCAVAWSARDAWVLTSLGHDGRVFAHHVPSAEKYKILL
ncbi:hypothetical protein JKP88DRAFT_354368 [Tribonema minus]|uniref:EIPR1-like beta-propeller domain-containing protein n=1 Tax=Tribonema minus TaxID=303371 RepID=A0A835Z343_9STRA|nr:hypothetical protein JKP88DRAFT_354368 [Tribonema minus]